MTETAERTVLHVGCGPANPEKLPTIFREAGWREVRFDIDPSVKPDLIGTMTDMSAVETASVDALYSSHNVEHLRLHDGHGSDGGCLEGRAMCSNGIGFAVQPVSPTCDHAVARARSYIRSPKKPSYPQDGAFWRLCYC